MNSPADTPEEEDKAEEAEAVEEPVTEDAPKEASEETEATNEAEESVEEPEDKLPDFSPGDTVKVHLRVQEGERERMQIFEGMVIAKRGSKRDKTFTVRKISFGVGVEKIFPERSPVIAKLEVVSRGDVRRAKLYYLRDRVGKAAKVKQKRDY